MPARCFWRDDFSATSLPELARRIRPASPVTMRGPTIPADASGLVLPVSVVGGNVSLEAEVLTPAGRFLHLDLGVTHGHQVRVLRVALPETARGGRVVGLGIGRALAVEQHASEFTRVDGILRLGRLSAALEEGPSGRWFRAAKWLVRGGLTLYVSTQAVPSIAQQVSGRFQVPVADCALTTAGFDTYAGEVMSIGERPPVALLDAAAASRLAIAEAITNLAAAPIGPLGLVKLSCNWMAAAGHPGEDARLYAAVPARAI